MLKRHLRASPERRLATPVGLSTQALAIAALVVIPAAILADLPRTPPPREAGTAERQFSLACTRTFDAAACGCAATGLRAVLGRDEFRTAVLRNVGNIFGDREHSASAHRMIDACIGAVVPSRSE